MFIDFSFVRVALVALCLALVGCTINGGGCEPLTHTASLQNIGKQDAFDAVLYFGPGGYKMGIMPAGVAKHISRTDEDIPEYASAEWKRADGAAYKGKVRVVKPTDMDKRERYVIQFDDNNELSLKVEFPKPIPKISD